MGTRTSTPKTLAPELQTPKISTPELQYPNFNTLNLNTRYFNTHKTSTPKFQTPEIKSQGKAESGYGCRARHVLRGLNFRLILMGTRLAFRLTHWAGWVHTIVLTPRPIPAAGVNYVPRLETVGGPGSHGNPAASLPWRLRTQCLYFSRNSTR